EALLTRAGRAVYVQDVSGVHSGANPVSGEFSVGATGLRVEGGALAAPLREMTIASTIVDMLKAVVAVGADLRFGGPIGSPPMPGPASPTRDRSPRFASAVPRMAGIARRNESRAAASSESPRAAPTAIVAPAREIPGTMARAWASPTATASANATERKSRCSS